MSPYVYLWAPSCQLESNRGENKPGNRRERGGEGASLRTSAPCSWFGCPTPVAGVPEPGFQCPDVLGCPFFGVLGVGVTGCSAGPAGCGGCKMWGSTGSGLCGVELWSLTAHGKGGGTLSPIWGRSPQPPAPSVGRFPTLLKHLQRGPRRRLHPHLPELSAGAFLSTGGGTHGGTRGRDPELLPGVPSPHSLFPQPPQQRRSWMGSGRRRRSEAH